MHNVFVYGSLLSGMHNHSLLMGAKQLGQAVSNSADYQMFTADHASFPFLIEGSNKVVGELYACTDDQLRKLDVLEGHPEFYTRKQRIFICRGVHLDAWVYMYRGSVHRYHRVEGNDWRKYKTSHSETASAH